MLNKQKTKLIQNYSYFDGEENIEEIREDIIEKDEELLQKILLSLQDFKIKYECYLKNLI